MKLGSIFGITLITVLMVWFEWSRLTKNQKKEKRVILILAATGWLLAILLVFYPEMPGPSELVKAIYGPLGKLLEK